MLRYFPGRVRWGSAALSRSLLAEHRRFDVIHSHNTFLPLNRAVAGVARQGARVFFHAHGALDPQLLAGWSAKAVKKRLYVAAFERRNYDTAQAIFGLTETECQQLALVGSRAAIYEVGNGIGCQPSADPLAAVAFRLKHRIPTNGQVILFIGRITHKKGLHCLIAAMPAVLAQAPDALLVIGGDRGQDIAYVRSLDRQIQALNLEASIRWTGFMNETGKRAAFASCRLFAHPSYSEGMALAILEAMASGVPTVVTPGCYMGAAVKAGALAESRQDSADLASTLRRLLTDQDENSRLGEAGAAYVRQNHTWEVLAHRLGLIYRNDPLIQPFRPALNS